MAGHADVGAVDPRLDGGGGVGGGGSSDTLRSEGSIKSNSSGSKPTAVLSRTARFDEFYKYPSCINK